MNEKLRKLSFGPLLALMVCLALATTVWGQSTTAGGITGSVTDQTGAVIPNAAVTIRNVDTNRQVTTSSDAEGRFRVMSVTPGTYAVETTAANFAPNKAGGIVVQIGVVTTLEIRLGVAAKAELVEVTGEAAVVNTVQSDFANNINQQSINDLPINGRRWSNFAMLAPGAGPDGNYGLISFRGISGLMNNSTVDGGDNNQAFFAEERGRTRASYVVSQSSVREFQVTTSNYSAEYGRAAGAVVNTVTKSGGNTLHGTGWYYIRDNELGATNKFTTQAVKDSTGAWTRVPYKPTDRRQQFGLNLGGPIRKDKLFFFFNYDGQRWNMPGVAMPDNPDALFKAPTTNELNTLVQRMYSCNPTATPPTCTQAQTDAAKAAFTAGQDFLVATTGTQPRNNPQDVFFPKLDWTLSPSNTLSLSYNRMRHSGLAMVQSPAVVNRGVNDWGDDNVKVDIVNARLSSAISNNISNEMRFSWGRDFEYQVSSKQQSAAELALAAKATVPSYGGYLPETYMSDLGFQIGRPYYTERYAYPDEHRSQFANSTTWAQGKHVFKFGFDFSTVNDVMNHINRGGGAYSYDYRVDWITDYTQFLRGVTNSRNYYQLRQGLGRFRWEFNTNDYALFLQDEYRVLPRLTLSLGVRYEYEQLPAPQVGNPALLLTQHFPTDSNNAGPRVGFALDVFGNGKTSVRGGYGMYYGRIINSTIASAIYTTGLLDSKNNPMGQANYTVKPASSAPVWPNVLATAGTQKADLAMFNPHMQNPQIHQADLIFEQEVAKNTVVSASYLLSLGRELVNFVDTNLAPTTTPTAYTFLGGPVDGLTTTVPVYTGSRPNGAYNAETQFISNINSSYNALVVQVNRRMTDGLQFQSSYTWSHALDYGQNSATFFDANDIYDQFNYTRKQEYGNSNFDIRHRIVGSAVWQPQFFKNSGGAAKAILYGWTIAPVVSVNSGRPFTEYTSGSPALPSGTYYISSGFNGSGGPNRLAPMLGRNSWRYPWIQNVDLRLARTVKIGERHNVELVAEAFNLFNHPNAARNLNTLYRNCSTSTTPSCPKVGVALLPGQVPPNTWIYDSSFGRITGADATLFRERQVQFAVRYSF